MNLEGEEMDRINSRLPLKSHETKSRFNQKLKDNKLLSLSQREHTWNESYHSQEKPIDDNKRQQKDIELPKNT